MDRYDRIGVPLFPEALPQNQSFNTINGPVIVLSIEELRELWDAAVHHGEEAQRKDIWDKLHSPDFKTYLQSHGIPNT